jgi:hypothetical protein
MADEEETGPDERVAWVPERAPAERGQDGPDGGRVHIIGRWRCIQYRPPRTRYGAHMTTALAEVDDDGRADAAWLMFRAGLPVAMLLDLLLDLYPDNKHLPICAAICMAHEAEGAVV